MTERTGPAGAAILSSLEALDMAFALVRWRLSGSRSIWNSSGASRGGPFRVSWLDFKLGLRMLVQYPGLTVITLTFFAPGEANCELEAQDDGSFVGMCTGDQDRTSQITMIPPEDD